MAFGGRDIVGDEETRSVVKTRQMITSLDSEALGEIAGYESELREMLAAFEGAILELTSATGNLNSEILAFNILDRFLYDPNALQNIDFYFDLLEEAMQTSNLNSVTSAIALSAHGILDLFRQILEKNPAYDLSQAGRLLEEIRLEKEALEHEIEVEKARAAEAERIRQLSHLVEETHARLTEDIEAYHTAEISENGWVSRATSIGTILGLGDVVIGEDVLPRTKERVLEIISRGNTNAFMELCSPALSGVAEGTPPPPYRRPRSRSLSL